MPMPGVGDGQLDPGAAVAHPAPTQRHLALLGENDIIGVSTGQVAVHMVKIKVTATTGTSVNHNREMNPQAELAFSNVGLFQTFSRQS
jgi:hypothetical protein